MTTTLERIEDNIVRNTAMVDSIITDEQDRVQEFIFKNLNLLNYINNPLEEMARLQNLLGASILDSFEEALEEGYSAGDDLERISE